MKRILFSLFIICSLTLSQAQEVPKQILVEHFTNTFCSLCAARNPAFYNTIANYSEVVHVAYHPSAPYAGCPLNQHNMTENDARTNFYGIYGGTPRSVVNGTVVPSSTSVINNTVLSNANMETTPFTIDIEQFQAGNDSMYVEITINTVASTVVTSANLVVLVGEKVLNFNAQNGENVHYDVFRKFLTDEPISLAANGSSVSFTYGTLLDQEWTPSELTTTVIVQESNKNVLQSAQSAKLNFNGVTAIRSNKFLEEVIYPNPAKNVLYINNETQALKKIEIYNIIGSKMKEVHLESSQRIQVPISSFERGSYIIRIYDKDNQVYTRKIVFSS